jgi:hypothetical protein
MFKISIATILITISATIGTTMGLSMAPPKKYYGGAGVGRFTLDDGESWQCAYDMVLVERIQGKPKTQGGLFVPEEDMPKLHLCRGELDLQVQFLAVIVE